jgi:aminoglycoside 6'-N-acetyltransferase
MRRWLSEPHARLWWGDPEEGVAEMRAAIEDQSTEAFVVEFAAEPIAYLQHYDPHLEEGHPYRDQPIGTLGIDLTIGPERFLGQGHGPAILKAHALRLFSEGAVRLIVDPHPTNTRAIQACVKAGFTKFDERETIYGHTLLMARGRKEER